MKKRSWLLLILTVLGVAGLLYLALRPALPSYQGQSLDVWFKKLPPTTLGWGSVYTDRGWKSTNFGSWYQAGTVTYNTTNRSELHRTLHAIQTIGTNGLPYIMKQFTREDNRIEKWLGKTASAIGFRVSLGDHALERRQAVTALLANNPLPPNVVATLKALSSSTNQEISGTAKFVLSMTTGGRELILE